jgi:hypothetical protein
MNIEVFDIVEVVTNPRQEDVKLATVLQLTDFEGEPAAVIQYHYNSCSEQTVSTAYMKKHVTA